MGDYAAECRAMIEARQRLVAEKGAKGALDFLIATGRQEEAARDVLKAKDYEAWDKHWPTPPRAAGEDGR